MFITSFILSLISAYQKCPRPILSLARLYHAVAHTQCMQCRDDTLMGLLRSAVGMTHDLRSDLWWTIPIRILLGQFWDNLWIPHDQASLSHFGESLIVRLYSEIDQIHLSSEAQCVSHQLPQVDCHRVILTVMQDMLRGIFLSFPAYWSCCGYTFCLAIPGGYPGTRLLAAACPWV